jgi:hypothetical protein
MRMVDVHTGETLDIITIGSARMAYASGAARPIVEAALAAYRRRGITVTCRAAVLDGWTDDRVRLEASAPVLEEGWIPQVPNELIDLREAGSDRKLRAYWTRGEGAAKIGWGSGGDFKRCVTHLGKYVADPEGLCAEYHKAATGEWPGKGRKH